MAAGRCKSAATRPGLRPSLRNSSASFAAVVVLPEPWRPASRITVGGRGVKASCELPEPIRAVSSSWTILTTCCPGVMLFRTSWPSARSRTWATKSLTTSKLTSASSRASRISRMAREIASSSSLPRPRRSPRAPWSRSDRASNTAAKCRGAARLGAFRPQSYTQDMAVSRRTVTVLFADVADSTPLGERLDPESLRRVMSSFFEGMSAVLERHGGTVEKFIGDAVMAVFGIPELHEDDALRAVRAATELRQALSVLNDELERDLGVRIGMRVGINTGEVVAGDGTGGQMLATGDAVNVAKRLEESARTGEILLGEPTRRLVENAVVLEPRDELTLKGKSDPYAAWNVLAVIEGASAYARRLDAPLIGRANELQLLCGVYDEAVAARSCRLFTVVGPAGIGKSRLAAELCTSLRDDATLVTRRCLAYGEGITLLPPVRIVGAPGSGRGGRGRVSDAGGAALVA